MKKILNWLGVAALTVLAGHDLPAAERTYLIAVIPKGTTHEFWKSIHAVAVKVQREFAQQGIKVDLIWKGPLREDDRDQQIQVVENFMTRRVDGMVLAPLDPQALVAPVVNAIKAGIQVVIFDSDLNTDKRVSFVATDNYKGGALAADYLGKLVGGKGNVIMLRCAVGSATTEAREAGFLNTIKSNYPAIRIVSSDQYGGATRESSYQASQNLLNRHGRNGDGIFCPKESTAVGMAKALRDLGKTGSEVKMVGFDTSTQLVQDLKRGNLQGFVARNPMLKGYLGVLTLVKHLQGKPVEKRVDTGVTLVTSDNMEQPDIRELLNPPLGKYLN